jgi:hypothetical protein
VIGAGDDARQRHWNANAPAHEGGVFAFTWRSAMLDE